MNELEITKTTIVNDQQSPILSNDLAELLRDKVQSIDNFTSSHTSHPIEIGPQTAITTQQDKSNISSEEQSGNTVQIKSAKRPNISEDIDTLPRKKFSVSPNENMANPAYYLNSDTPLEMYQQKSTQQFTSVLPPELLSSSVELINLKMLAQSKSKPSSTQLVKTIPVATTTSALTTTKELPSLQSTSQKFSLGSATTKSPLLFPLSPCKPASTLTIAPELKEKLEKIINHKNFDTGKPRLEIEFCRFTKLTTYKDDKFSYSANTVPNMPFHIGEGPYTHNEVVRFFKNVLFNIHLDKNPIEYIIAAGHPNEGNKFYNYFNIISPVMLEEFDEQKEFFEADYDCSNFKNNDDDDEDSEDNNFSTIHLKMTEKKETPDGNLVFYKMSVKLDNKLETEVKVLNLPKFNEFSTTSLSQNDVKELLNIYQRCKNNNTTFFIHCAAGRGRTGILALAFILFEHYDECYEQDGTPKYNSIAKKLWTLRDIRPGAIQRAEQLQMAIDLGRDLKKVYSLDLDAQNERNNNSSHTNARP